jgi:hypothetical protein
VWGKIFVAPVDENGEFGNYVSTAARELGARRTEPTVLSETERMKADSPDPKPVTVAELTEGEWHSRCEALARLPANERVPAKLHAAVVGLLAAPEAEQRTVAVLAVARVRSPAVPLLLALLADESQAADTRRAVVVALGQLGPVALPSVPRLVELVEDPWLGPCVRAALAAIAPRRTHFPLLCSALAFAALVGALLIASPAGFSMVAGAVAVVAVCVAIGVWWTRPGFAGLVWAVAVGMAVAAAVLVTGSTTGVFAEVARVLARP